jgi:hypothetical protein
MNLDQLTGYMIEALSEDYPAAMAVLVDCLDLIPFELPEVGRTAREVAERVWIKRDLPEAALQAARVKCWEYLDDRSAGTNVEEPEFCAVRAVICTLYSSDPPDDLVDTIDFFNQVLESAVRPTCPEDFVAALKVRVDSSAREE